MSNDKPEFKMTAKEALLTITAMISVVIFTMMSLVGLAAFLYRTFIKVVGWLTAIGY